jgi:glycosyltransferase involved in cell wall biosynthesis
LVAIGGFDEEIEYFLDETDVCARLIDSGREIRQIDGAPVHHRYLASHLRTERRIINNPYPIIKNRLYFGLHHGLRSHSLAEIVKSTRTRATEFHRYMTAGGSEEERANYRRVLDRAIDDGLARFGRGTRLTRDFRSPAPAAEFLPFPTRTPEGGKLVVCLVSQEIPPERYGGIARFTYDLACEFAEEGHEVHYVASCPDHDRVDYERSFWVHRVVTRDDPGVGLGKTSFVRMNILRSMAVHREIERIARDRRIDIVEAPIWDCEGFVSSLDDDLATVVSLQTTVKVMEQVNRIWRESPETASRIALERLSLEHAPYIHAISRAVLLSTEQDHAITFDRERCGLAMLGIPDPTRCARGPANAEVVSDHPAPIRVLFVGRIEPRKGTDLLLDAAVELLPEFSNLEFHLVGDHSIANERGSTDRAEFLEAHERSITDRVQFHGVVPESELHTHYERSDIFCAPSRFESFGLILLEAMAAGKPVVSCNVGGIPEVVADGENGILVAPGDSSALAGAIRRLILDPELRREMGKRSRVRFQESWSSQAMAGGVLAFYRRILRQRRSHAA